MSDYLLSIHAENQKVVLSKGKYNVYIVGGHSVDEHSFSISLVESATQGKVSVGRAPYNWRRILRGAGKAVCYYQFEVKETGEYEVHFHRPETLVVYRDMLWSLRKLFGSIHNSEIYVAIRKKR